MKSTIDYLAPDIEVEVIEVEMGFSASNIEDPYENPELEW